MRNVMKLSDIKIGDIIYIYYTEEAVTVVGFPYNDYDILVQGDSLVWRAEKDGTNVYGISEEDFANIEDSGSNQFMGIGLEDITSRKVMKSKLADKLYKNIPKHGETEEYFYVTKDI